MVRTELLLFIVLVEILNFALKHQENEYEWTFKSVTDLLAC